jgi:hypothetical protein
LGFDRLSPNGLAQTNSTAIAIAGASPLANAEAGDTPLQPATKHAAQAQGNVLPIQSVVATHASKRSAGVS